MRRQTYSLVQSHAQALVVPDATVSLFDGLVASSQSLIAFREDSTPLNSGHVSIREGFVAGFAGLSGSISKLPSQVFDQHFEVLDFILGDPEV